MLPKPPLIIAVVRVVHGPFGRDSFSEDERVLRAACLIESSPACNPPAAQGMDQPLSRQATIFESTEFYYVEVYKIFNALYSHKYITRKCNYDQ